MKTYDLIIFDADGTLRECTVPGQPCPNKPGEWRLMPGVIERLKRIDWRRTKFGIASNQAGIAFGFLSEEQAFSLLQELIAKIRKSVDIPEVKIEMCPHHPEVGCSCRKPEPEMIENLIEAYGVDKNCVLYVGDKEADRKAAENAGIDFQWAHEFFR